MEIRKNVVLLPLSALVFGSLVGCGRSPGDQGGPYVAPTVTTTVTTTQGQTGKVAQGEVSGATVWADSLTSGTRFVIDTDEQSTQTTTDANGNFTLPVQPSYQYVVVSQGGTDIITGKTATTMLAPAGTQSVSPLTAVVALDTTGKLAGLLDSLLPAGKTYDDDITASAGLTPAALILLNSIESIVNTINTTIQDAATKANATLTQQQQNDIDLTLYSSIATQLATLSSGELSNTADLADNLQTAVSTALSTITTNNPNITFSNASTLASSIANNAVATAAQVVGNATGNTALQDVTAANVQSTPETASTSSTVTESTVMTAANTAIINSTTTTVATTDSSDVTVGSTPTTYTPPVIPVINNPTITGYDLQIAANGSAWTVTSFRISFSESMVATASGSTFGNSVLNPANYQFSQGGCTPTSLFAANVVTFTCSQNLTPGTFTVETYQGTSTTGVQASATSLGLSVNNTKTFTVPTVTGSTGGSSLQMF